jgi:hypothetical protein
MLVGSPTMAIVAILAWSIFAEFIGGPFLSVSGILSVAFAVYAALHGQISEGATTLPVVVGFDLSLFRFLSWLMPN